MGGDVSKIAKEAGVSEDHCKNMLKGFKSAAGKEKTIVRSTFVQHKGGVEAAGNAFDTYCTEGKMGPREYVLASLALEGGGSRPPSAPQPQKGKPKGKGSGHALGGGGGGGQQSLEEEREKRARAAEARMQQAAQRGAGSKAATDVAETEEERRMQRQKQDKVGKIRATLATLGETEPFGLASMPPEKLAAYHTHLEQKLQKKRGGAS